MQNAHDNATVSTTPPPPLGPAARAVLSSAAGSLALSSASTLWLALCLAAERLPGADRALEELLPLLSSEQRDLCGAEAADELARLAALYGVAPSLAVPPADPTQPTADPPASLGEQIDGLGELSDAAALVAAALERLGQARTSTRGTQAAALLVDVAAGLERAAAVLQGQICGIAGGAS